MSNEVTVHAVPHIQGEDSSMSFLKFKKPELSADQKRRLPPGQVLTDKWPVLHASYVPRFDPQTWDFRIWGLVEQPAR